MKESERAAIHHALGNIDERCTRVLASFPGVHVVGIFAYDRGCMDRGYVHPGGVEKSLEHASPVLGEVFARGDAKAAEAAALAWAQEAMFQNRSLSEAPEKGFGGKREPVFTPPSAKRQGDGRITVTLWVASPIGMIPIRRFTQYEVTFSASGDVEGKKVLGKAEQKLR